MIFNIDNYKDILNRLKLLSEPVLFKDIRKDSKRKILIRHDIDIDFNQAYELFLIEKSMNIKSTWFILLTSDMYNPLCDSIRDKLLFMKDSGYEIGLHFDQSNYSNTNIKKELMSEINILNNIINDDIYTYSIHNLSLIGNIYDIENIGNANTDKYFFNDRQYISDSCMSFRNKDIFDFIESNKSDSMQLCFHPEHWIGGDYRNIFNRWNVKLCNDVHKRFMEQNKTYKKEMEDEKWSDTI